MDRRHDTGFWYTMSSFQERVISMAQNPAYTSLEQVFHQVAVLDDAMAALHWDMAVMMPAGGAETRSEQLALLKSMAHALLTGPAIADWLAQAQDESLDGWERANLGEMRRLYGHAAALPSDLVQALAKAETTCEMIWRDARKDSDFARVAPSLDALLSLVRQSGQAKAQALGVSAHAALLDQFEPGGSLDEIDALFADLEDFLPTFLAQVTDAQSRHPTPRLPPGPFSVDRQRDLGRRIMGRIGFDFHHGRQDESAHPFCGGYPGDIRLTTRYDEADFTSALMGIIHETGHALYEAGLPGGRWRYQPVGRARGMQMHESQSLLMEMQVCRSRTFLNFATPLIRDCLNGSGAGWDADNLYALGTWVRPDFIRVDADEVTYPAHVIIRHRLETAMLSGQLAVADLPGAWNDGYARLLGITPANDRLGCLQDIHWYSGSFGYFPTYTLGAMTAAQLFNAAIIADTGILPAIGRGDFAPLLDWLRRNVHELGSRLSTRDLLTQATGRPLDATVFKNHLHTRYLAPLG